MSYICILITIKQMSKRTTKAISIIAISMFVILIAVMITFAKYVLSIAHMLN